MNEYLAIDNSVSPQGLKSAATSRNLCDHEWIPSYRQSWTFTHE